MGAFVDLTGMKFSRLLVLGLHERKPKGESTYICRCDCGVEKTVSGRGLRSGSSRSCGCYHREVTSKTNRKHGLHKHPLYKCWASIRARCFSKIEPNYESYGATGITMCERWASSFPNFLEDMGEKPSPKHSIDRIDNSGDYEPSNCRWATDSEQVRNASQVRAVIRSDGVKFNTIKDAAFSVGVHVTAVRAVCIGKGKASGGYGWAYLTPRLKPKSKIIDYSALTTQAETP